MRLKLKSILVRLVLASFFLYFVYSFFSGSKPADKKRTFIRIEPGQANELKTKDEPDMHYDDHADNLVKNHPIINQDNNNNNNRNEQINEPKLIEKLRVNNDVDKRSNLKSSGKKDWHNYQQIAEENQRQGPGEHGAGTVLTLEEKNSNIQRNLFSQNGFNALVSDKISLQRSVADIRHEKCKKRLYLENMPKVSIVIPFHDEHLSVLLRSIYSIVKRTPPELLEEIILVDDFSTKKFLKEELEDHIAENFKNDLVKIIRNKKREGLIRTRMAGANIAKAEILVFFDSHIECSINWLPPLIEPIVLNYTTAVCPFIDVINDDTFAYTAQDNGARGAFDWELYYKRLPLLSPSPNSDPTDPFDSPVMAGGLFAISKKWFYTLGGYDEGLEIWGGEQYELSFKIWQCGGSLVDAPCSRVGHIYRKFNPFGSLGAGDYLSKNYKRVAEIWMDEYKEYIYKKKPHYKNIDMGDISKQVEIRNKLQCKPFKWFMEKVAFDLVNYYPPIPPPNYAEGEIRSVASKLCIDTKFKDQANFGLDLCQSSNKRVGGEQKFELTWHSDIRPMSRSQCFDVSRSDPGVPVVLFSCHGMKGNQEFRYNLKTLQIYHPISRQCLDSNTERKEIFMNPCKNDSDTQKWQFERSNSTLIKRDFKFN